MTYPPSARSRPIAVNPESNRLQIIKSVRLSLLLVLLALLSPFFNESLANIRWVLFSGITALYVAKWSHYLRVPELKTLFVLFLLNGLLRILSIAWSPDPFYTAQRSVSLFLMTFYVMALCSLAVRENAIRGIVQALMMWAALIIAMSGAMVVLGYQNVPFSGLEVYRGITNRFAGVLGNPNQLGIFLIVSLPLMAAWWLEQTRRRWFLLPLLLAGVWMLIASGSRAGVLSLIAGAGGILFVLRIQYRVAIIVSIILGSIALSVVDTKDLESSVAGFFNRGPAKSFDLEEAASNRLERWELGWKSISKRPLFGQGYGIGGVNDGSNPLISDFDRGYALHNSYLQIWQENGLLGLVLTIVLLLGAILKVLKIKVAPSRITYLTAGLVGVVFAGITSSFFESWLLSVGNIGTLPFWLSLVLFNLLLANLRR